jgi:NAD(P)-dependent dehydrogenase (short-subunit alcohol dehydrogenase family)
MDPCGRIAVVTGAAGGIGGALVRALAAAGASTVIATDLAAADVEALAAEQGPTVVGRRLDVADEAATLALVEDIERSHGPIDLWFANAGVAGGGDESAPDATWELQWRVNVMSHVYAARALLPGWIARGEGHLVTTASMAGLLTSVGDAPYAATKHAAVGFAEWLAFTHADQGVKVSCICPGAVDTPMLRAGAGGDAAKATAIIGGGEVMTPDEVAARVLAAVAEDRFLILTHPEMAAFVAGKAEDPDRWIRGMARLWARARTLLAG